MLAIVLFLETGHQFAKRRSKKGGSFAVSPLLQGAIFALMGLLIGFTFSGAGSRFDARRQLTGEEANAIGTAYLRIDMLPPDAQPQMRDLFRQYVDARLAAYQKLPDKKAAIVELERSAALQSEIWKLAVSSSQRTQTTAASMLLLPAINAMIDVTTTQTVAAETHPPGVLWVMLLGVTFACAFIAGHSIDQASRSWIDILCFAVIFTLALYVVADLEYPRWGLIQIHSTDHVLEDLRNTMK